MPKPNPHKSPAHTAKKKKTSQVKRVRSDGNGNSPKPFHPGLNDHRGQLYMQFPPNGPWKMEDVPKLANGYIPEIELPIETHLNLQAKEIQFREWGAIGCLRFSFACMEAGVCPPRPVLNQIEVAAKEYLASEDNSLEKAFGLNTESGIPN